MLKVHRNIVAADIRSHGHYWGTVKLPNQVRRRYPVQIRHDDVHQYQVVFRAGVQFVDRFQTVKLETLVRA